MCAFIPSGMLKAMKFSVLMILTAVLPALADTRFQVRRMTRDDVPSGKGQCDIRLQVDNEVEVQFRGETVQIRTISGQGARDDGSECNMPLPTRDIEGFRFEVKDSRNEIRLLSEPSRRNNFSAIVQIRDNSGGFGRYHFRISWNQTGGDHRSPSGSFGRDDPGPRGGGPGFSWNNTVTFRGNGRGEASTNNLGQTRLSAVSIDIDQGGKIFASFRGERGRTITFSGSIMAREGNRWKADVASEDRRLRGPMYFSVDDRNNVNTVTVEATDGRDRMKLNWDRR